MMSTEEEQKSGESLCQSVLLFACKGVIEGIIVLLFLWLLVQVLFTKQLEVTDWTVTYLTFSKQYGPILNTEAKNGRAPVHLQVLLSVGLALLCLTLILGCVLWWHRTRHKPSAVKKDVTSRAPPDSADHMTIEFSPSPSSGTTSTKLQYEELDGEVLDNTSMSESLTPSDETFTSAVSEVKHKVCFQMRRLSTPTISTSLYRPMASSRSSLPSFPKIGLLSQTRKVVESHCSVVGNEDKILTVPKVESPYTLSSFQTNDLQGEHLFPNYGSNSCNETSFLHFTLNFSSMHITLNVAIVGITGKIHSLDEVTVRVRLCPLCSEPLDMSVQDQNRDNLVVNVGSLKELKGCILRLAFFSRDHTETSPIGEVEVRCGDLDWTPDRPISCVRELGLRS